jgi:hypothetical protein
VLLRDGTRLSASSTCLKELEQRLDPVR